MQNNEKHRLKIIHNNKTNLNKTSFLKNNEIENIIISASKLNNNPEVKIYFKNIPAHEYNMGYKKFCGVKVKNLAFYNPSLFDLYPKFIDYIYISNTNIFKDIILSNHLDTNYFSFNENSFVNHKRIINSNIYLNLDITFDEMINVLDKVTESIYDEKVLKVLIISSAKK